MSHPTFIKPVQPKNGYNKVRHQMTWPQYQMEITLAQNFRLVGQPSKEKIKHEILKGSREVVMLTTNDSSNCFLDQLKSFHNLCLCGQYIINVDNIPLEKYPFRLQHRCSSVNIAKFFRAPISKNRRLLLTTSGFFQSLFEANEMFCLFVIYEMLPSVNKFVLFTNKSSH